MRLFAALGFLLLGSGYAAPAADESPVVDWIRSNAIPLRSAQAGNGFADMQPLKKVIGNARIVSLGEATHGSREFFQLKHRMMEFLASEMGFTIFSIEANMPEAYRLNEYVLTGKGDPKQLLKGMYFWTWNTEEVLDMILWMREFNRSGKGRVEFTGFDMQIPSVAMDIVKGFVAANDPGYAGALEAASKAALNSDTTSRGGAFGVATGTFPILAAAGKRVRFSGSIKTQGSKEGFAGLWWRVDGKLGVLAFDNMQNRGITGDMDWKPYSLELPVASDARNINFGALYSGKGTAWFSGLTIELDGQPYSSKADFDLDFASGSARGFYTGGNGYAVQVNNLDLHEGKKVLEIRHTGSPVAATPKADPNEAASAWRGVISHLDSSRETYKNSTNEQIDWAIQNARVVLQCMQMRAGTVSRDESMAANVKWILDHFPKAKIVLWAHNGHVNASGFRGYAAMGGFLRKTYGDEMKVFGFAFHEGSFQAVLSGKGLQDFTVPPAPAGSLDAIFAATGIPLFALNLHSVPKEGPVAEWFGQSHGSRNIGALYPADSPYAYMTELNAPAAFDALLFVAKTTAARKVVEPRFIERKLSVGGASEFVDEQTRIGVTLPPGWGVRSTLRGEDRKAWATLSTPQASVSATLFFQIHDHKQDEAEREAMLAKMVDAKAPQRLGEGFTGYKLRDGSCRKRVVAGNAARSCIGEWEGGRMVEYFTWIRTEGSNALLSGRMPAAMLDEFIEKLDAIIESIRMP